MIYSYLADLIVLLHISFVLFVLLGGFLLFWKPATALYHFPAVLWAAGLEFWGWICPLTPLENMLRTRAGASGYATGFVEHYLIPLLYPAVLTGNMQIGIGLIVLIVNSVIYLYVWQKTKTTKNRGN